VKSTFIIVAVFASVVCFGQALNANLRGAGFTELHAAAWNGDVKRIRALVRDGMQVNVASNFGTTPLHSATMKNQVEAIRALIELGADLEARDSMGRTPLFVTVEVNPNPKPALEALLAAGASPTATDKFGKTPMQVAWTDEARQVLAVWQSKSKLQ
jgi:ankyrin repeat protein